MPYLKMQEVKIKLSEMSKFLIGYRSFKIGQLRA